MIISDKHRFIFFEAGKTGSSSIRRCLEPYASPYGLSEEDFEKYNKHMPPAILRDRIDPERWNTYLKFAFIRNPWDWVVSQCFHNKIAGRNNKGGGYFKKISVNEIDEMTTRVPLRGITWSDYRTQYAFLTNSDGELLVDHIGRFEKLQEDFDGICSRIGIPTMQLPLMKTTTHRHYSYYYTKKSKAHVARLFEKDIQTFDYTLNDLPRLNQIVEDVKSIRQRLFRRV